MAITIEALREAKQQAKKLGKPIKLSVGDGIRLNISKSSAVFQLRYIPVIIENAVFSNKKVDF